jgi:hypothetical protein
LDEFDEYDDVLIPVAPPTEYLLAFIEGGGAVAAPWALCKPYRGSAWPPYDAPRYPLPVLALAFVLDFELVSFGLTSIT